MSLSIPTRSAIRDGEQMIREATYAELEEMTQEDIDRAREAQEREAENPYSKDKMKNYLEALLGIGRRYPARRFR